MKKHLSIFGLFARSSIYKIIGILSLLSIVESSLFALHFTKDILSKESIRRFELYISYGKLNICLAISFVLITFLLCLPTTEFSSKVSYTIKRLQISEKLVFLYQAIFNTFMYLILWAVHVLIVFILGICYSKFTPTEFANNQSVFLSFYRYDFLHSLLPLSEIILLFRNVLLLIALGTATAEFTYLARRKKYSSFAIPVLVFVLFFFVCDMGSSENILFSAIMFIITICKALHTVFHKEVSYDK